jgi:hypothetical protein
VCSLDFLQDETAQPETLSALTAEVDTARRALLEASQNLLKVTRNVPTGIQAADGVLRIQLPANERERAFERYRRACKRLEEHVAKKSTSLPEVPDRP